MQGAGDGTPIVKIAACCKHFYGYSLEDSDGFTRHNFDARISKRDLAETYLPAFRACAAAQVEQVMCRWAVLLVCLSCTLSAMRVVVRVSLLCASSAMLTFSFA